MNAEIIALLWVHWFSDFVLQTDKMAMNKSTSWAWLSSHAVVYSTPLIFFGWKFAVINGVAHLAVDAVTSRWTSYLWKKGARHNFFVVIGLDQAIHVTVLVITFWWLR